MRKLILASFFSLISALSFAQNDPQVPNLLQITAFKPQWQTVYDKIIPNNFECDAACKKQQNSIWLQYQNANNKLDAPAKGNTLKGNIDMEAGGAAFGFSRYIKDDSMLWGLFFDYTKDKYTYNAINSYDADVNNYNLGFYGGAFGEKIDLKTVFSVGYNTYNSLFFIAPDSAEQKELTGYNAKFDIEGLYKIQVEEYFNIKPFLGLGLAYAFMDDYSITSTMINPHGVGDSTDIFSVFSRLGMQFDGFVNKKLYWYTKGYWKYAITGNQASHENASYYMNYLMQQNNYKGTEIDKSALGFGIGLNYKVYNTWGLYANYNMEKAGNYNNDYLSLGLNYSFKCKKAPIVAKAPEIIPPAPAPIAKPAILYTIEGISFDFDKYNIKPEFEDTLQKAYATINTYDGNIIIEGHTDIIGSDAYNQVLSKKRAESVYNKLLEMGMPKEQMSYEGFGFTKLKNTSKTKAANAENRRVEIVTK